MRPTKTVLYCTKNGMLEPLGYSQVLAYLRGLSKHYNIVLISFEKDDDWQNIERRSRSNKNVID